MFNPTLIVAFACVSLAGSVPVSQKLLCDVGEYFNIIHQECVRCTTCEDPLVASVPCGKEVVPGFISDAVCCESYQYASFGKCYLNCEKCQVKKKCIMGENVCDCPDDRTGLLCEIPKSTLKPNSTTDVED